MWCSLWRTWICLSFIIMPHTIRSQNTYFDRDWIEGFLTLYRPDPDQVKICHYQKGEL